MASAASSSQLHDENDAAPQIELEQTLFQESRVWFYHVPAAHVSSLAPRADAWDPEHPFLTGSVQVLQKGDRCWIRMYEPPKDDPSASSGERTLFAQCPVEISKELTLELYVQDCADSSRYFMVRVEDEVTKRRAYLGVGFPERASAFNFKAALQDYVKYVHRQLEVIALAAQAAAASEGAGGEDGAPSPRTQDLSIPKGATIRINLKVNSGAADNQQVRRRTSSEGLDGRSAASPPKVPLIPPPPADPLALASPSNKAAQTMKASAVDEDEDWGDFTSA